MSLIKKASELSPLDKISVLLNEVESLRSRVENLTSEQSIDNLLDVIDMQELGRRFAVSPQLMRKKLILAGGKVFKLGKKHVIRKVNFLRVLETLENDIEKDREKDIQY